MKIKLNGISRLERDIEYLNTHAVIVGVIGKYSDLDVGGTKVWEYAIMLNNGTINMPARPFFDRVVTTKKAQKKILKRQAKLFRDVIYNRMTPRRALEILGEYMVERIKREIMSGNFAPLAPSTIAQKTQNKDKILREHDNLLNSVDFEVIRI